MDNTPIDLMYIKYNKMWKEDRWKFSGRLVQLNIKQKRDELTHSEQYELDMLDRIVLENEGKWLEGYDWHGKGLMKIHKNKDKKK